MKVKDLKEVLWSPIGDMQSAVVYDLDRHEVVADGCSIEYAVAEFGEWHLCRLGSRWDSLVLTVMKG